MAHIAFSCPPFLGHLDPMAALAAELRGRGHQTTYLGIPDAGPLAAARGFAVRPVGGATHPPGHLASLARRMVRAGSPFGLPALVRDVAAMTDALCRDLPEALRSIAADLLVCDGTEAAGGLVAASLGLPLVTVSTALPLNREPGVPPPFTGWAYDPSPWGIERNRGGYRVADRLMRRHGDVIARWASRWRLPARRRIDLCLSDLAQISQTVPGFDVPRAAAPPHFHPVGPLRGAPRTFALPAEDGRPLAFASLGSLQGSRLGLFRAIAGGAGRADLRLVLAHGGGLDAAAAASLPHRPVVHAFVPQEAVLAGSRLALLNGGLNTVMDSLAAGVPVLALPIAFEQGAIAARLVRAGAGRSASRRFLGPRRVARHARAILSDPAYAASARRLAGEIAGAGGVRRAADVVERVLATGRPVPAGDVARGCPS